MHRGETEAAQGRQDNWAEPSRPADQRCRRLDALRSCDKQADANAKPAESKATGDEPAEESGAEKGAEASGEEQYLELPPEAEGGEAERIPLTEAFAAIKAQRQIQGRLVYVEPDEPAAFARAAWLYKRGCRVDLIVESDTVPGVCLRVDYSQSVDDFLADRKRALLDLMWQGRL